MKNSPSSTPKKIPLFYWSEVKFIFREKENYGDLLSKYLVERISGREVKFVQPKKQPWYRRDKKNYVAIGSIIHHADKNSIVWGSGIIDHQQPIAEAKFTAVRGPRTRQYLQSLGYECPEVYGDPAILLPDYYSPEVEKKFKLGIVPHYHDYENAQKIFSGWEGVKVIDLLTMDVEATTREILECKKILSTSLHGLIVAHTYKIPAVWVKMSDKIFGNDIKYADYLESVGIETYSPIFVKERISEEGISGIFKNHPVLVSDTKLKNLKAGLLEVKPF
ncbi:polysaccharide pyruvyl transferase family protein [Antarcticibacterium flavum]|uniref:Polysaccharide pyruvyl transferase family protein n=1 Tax=Antarcticibacterium flavum TaxID=2058175 RepID=A0A5B7X9R2_9FLAO|nr:polysaccharide pyruvyl transferase family protein [Antarcticibacterium sp. W02-3]QCY71458.1 polysaccharide pyruvyl transferase family protein [Antarcticibacterium flavum]